MLTSNTNHQHQNRMRRLFAQLSTLYEDSQEDNVSEYDIIESIEEHVSDETSTNIFSIADLLREKHAFITGGTSDRCTILTFSDHSQTELTQDKYKKLISYLTQVPSEHERQLGFVLIIDRRSEKWMSVKTLLGYIETYFPYAIKCIYVLRPNSWVQRALSQLTLLNDHSCSYRLIMCRTLAELHQYIDGSQLSKDLGGTIDFRLFEWIEQRATIEKLTQSIHELNETLLKFIGKCKEMEFPNSVESTQKLLKQISKQKNELEQEMKRIKTWGHSLLCIIRQEHKQSSSFHNNVLDKHNDIHHLILSPDQSAHARACINALTHLERAEYTLSQFWSGHKTRLNHCLALRQFEQRFKEIQCNFIQLYHELIKLPNININQQLSFETCQTNNHRVEDIARTLIQVDDLSKRTQTMISHATVLANDGLALIMEQQKQQCISYGIDSIEPKRQELEEMKKRLIEQIDEKRHNLKVLKVYIDKLGYINDWCIRGKDMLANHPIHLSNDKVLRSLNEFEHFLAELPTMNIEELEQISTQEPLRSMITQILHRMNDVRDLCEKRCEQLRQLLKPPHRPVQRVHPLIISQSDDSFNILATPPLSFLQKQQSSTDSSDKDLNALTNDAKIDRKLRHVVTELLVTEQVYVDELRTIINGYMGKFDDPEYNHLLSPIILQNKSILFSNLPEIYTFHASSFLRELQQISNDPMYSIGSAIASCFIKRKSNFKLYEQYVLNKSQSERLWEQYCSEQNFFTKIQQSLGHRLPLDSYLLKPIQRITQYQLLLKEMIKYTRHEQEKFKLQEALDVMLNILSYLNDVMHSTQIIGYPENINTLGQIRLRAEHCLISKEKRRGTVYMRTKTSTRDIFLFERMILLCKKREDNLGKLVQYQFKELIRIIDIAICAHTKTDRKKFEIVLKDCSYIVQLSVNTDLLDEMTLRWIETVKTSVTQMTEQRRADMKYRSSSVDQAARANRRLLKKHPTVPIRSLESDDESKIETKHRSVF